MIIDSAVYRNGVRNERVSGFDEMYAACCSGDAVAWLGLYEPSREELESVARAFGLHELAVEDAVNAHQRPKLERYDDTQFVVLRPARYVDETETVVFGEVDIFAGPHFVITVRHGEAPDLGHVRRALEARPDLLARGPLAIVYGIVDHVVDGYEPVVAGLENDIDEIEDEVFSGSADGVAAHLRADARGHRVPARHQAARRHPRALDGPARRGRRGAPLPARRPGPRDAHRGAGGRASATLLQNILSVHLTLETKALTEVAISQNEQVKKISAWAAILFAPTLIGTVYGMNFDTCRSCTGVSAIRSRSR